MRSRYVLVVLLAVVFQLVCGQGSNSITVPPDGFEVRAGEPITIDWTNPSPRTVTIQLVPDSGAGNLITLGSTLSNGGSATVPIPSDIPTTQKYKFKIIDDSNSSNVNFSPAFTISPPTSDSSPPGSTPASSATATAASAGSTAGPSSSHQSLSTGAIIGISIGLGIGLLLLAGIALFFLRRRRKHRKWMDQQRQQQQGGSVAQRRDNAPPYEMNQQDGGTDISAMSETVAANKVSESPAADGSSGRKAPCEPSEVSGSRSWPREMEAMSRFQQREIVELPANDMGGGSGETDR